ncbi:MAG: mannosylglycerate hydrolase [Sporolactobacillus sp.]|jgi:mannosylglycerate hydrolase|nr:mannosylglycerate hydrolase [Sporolactobacillus sp.]
MMGKTVYIVPHIHWDREWYFSTEESQILLINDMEEILNRLEKDEHYPAFVLDGQTVVLEDYLTAVPEAEPRIKKLVGEGKLIIGPWYTQTDEMIVGAESVVRNLLYGISDAKKFGEPMKIGYLPDSFGQSGQIPQILNGFDIHRSIFWRGMTEDNGTANSEFFWESPDGSKVLALLLPLGYAIGKYLPEDKEQLKKRMDENFAELDKRAATPFLLIPNGHDQMPLQQDIHEVIHALRTIYPRREFQLTDYEHLFDGLEKYGSTFNTVKGELLEGKYMRVHRSIYSTRMDIKALNTALENKVTNILEPLATLAYSLGFTYHHGLIELIWKTLMKNHAHDSMGGCCSDKVNREIKARYAEADERVDRLVDFYKRKIVDAMPDRPHQDKLTLFNFLPRVREEVVETSITTKNKEFALLDARTGEKVPYQLISQELIDPGLIDRQIVHYGTYNPFVKSRIAFLAKLPAVGFRTYKVISGLSKIMSMPVQTQKLENKYFEVTFNENGTIDLRDKQQNEAFHELLLIEDGGDAGDTYDYSPPVDDWVISSRSAHASVTVENGVFFDRAVITLRLAVPKNIVSRAKRQCDSFVDVSLTVKLLKNKRRIDIEALFHNHAEDHRLRVLFPTQIQSKLSVCDNQFGSIKRPVVDPHLKVWQKEGWEERPDGIYPMLSYVGLHDDRHGFAVLTDSTREYEITGENHDTIALTQFRSVGILGKADLVRRPGRPSGIALPTPDAQMKGAVKLRYALSAHSGDTIVDGKIPEMAKEYLTPVETYNKIKFAAMRLNAVPFQTPYDYSLFEQKDEDTVVSAIKKEENGSGIVIRMYNPSTVAEARSRLHFFSRPIKAGEANMNESEIHRLALENDLSLLHHCCQAKTYKVELSDSNK